MEKSLIIRMSFTLLENAGATGEQYPPEMNSLLEEFDSCALDNSEISHKLFPVIRALLHGSMEHELRSLTSFLTMEELPYATVTFARHDDVMRRTVALVITANIDTQLMRIDTQKRLIEAGRRAEEATKARELGRTKDGPEKGVKRQETGLVLRGIRS